MGVDSRHCFDEAIHGQSKSEKTQPSPCLRNRPCFAANSSTFWTGERDGIRFGYLDWIGLKFHGHMVSMISILRKTPPNGEQETIVVRNTDIPGPMQIDPLLLCDCRAH